MFFPKAKTPPGYGSLAPVRTHDNPKAPCMRGHLVLDRDYKAGEAISIAGWSKDFGTEKAGPWVIWTLAIRAEPDFKTRWHSQPFKSPKRPVEIVRDSGDLPL